MDALDIARWQFGIVTVYHFFFVPLTIGLAPLVAVMQTIWYKTGNENWLRLTKFFGKLLLINFAIGVVTGIVQEFQFGMNWSEYSRFVGDIFGAPLAVEGLAAFFIESTFLGLWIFGWDRLPKRIHLLTIWLVALGVNLSAYFILAANSWMQYPVGAVYNPETGRAEMENFAAILTTNTLIATFLHTVGAAFLTAGTFVAGIAAWWLVKAARAGNTDVARKLWRPAVGLGLVTIVASGLLVVGSGDMQAKQMFVQQPMKMAAAEALCDSEEGAPFSILAIGDFSNSCESVTPLIQVPGLLSFLAAGDFNAELSGVNDVQADFEQRFGEGVDYTPSLLVTFWSFRLMMLMAGGSVLLALAALWLLRKGRVSDANWFKWVALAAIPTPFLGAAFGWILREMGRQPWVVVPNLTGADQVWMLTQDGVSAIVPAWQVWASLLSFTAVYTVLGVIWFMLIKRYTRVGAPEVVPDEVSAAEPEDTKLSFAY